MTDAFAPALFARTTLPIMLTDAFASALLALTALPIMLTDAFASALLALTTLSIVHTFASRKVVQTKLAYTVTISWNEIWAVWGYHIVYPW